MTLAFWYWLLLIFFAFWYGGTDYRIRTTYGRWWWGRSLILVILLVIIGLSLFKDPMGTLVTGEADTPQSQVWATTWAYDPTRDTSPVAAEIDFGTLKAWDVNPNYGPLATGGSTYTTWSLTGQAYAIHVPRADIQRYLAGEVCFPRAPQSAPDGLPVILRQFPPSDPQEIANALVLALGAIPESHLIEVNDDLPVGFRDLGIVSHRGHHPFREQRLVGETIRPVRFCEERK